MDNHADDGDGGCDGTETICVSVDDPCPDDEFPMEDGWYYDEVTDTCDCTAGWPCDPTNDDISPPDSGEEEETGTGGSGGTGDTTSGDTEDGEEECDPNLDPDDGGCATTLPPLDEDVTLSPDPPDCTQSWPQGSHEYVWCNGMTPSGTRLGNWAAALEATFAACPELQDDWDRSKENIRTFNYQGQSFGGGSPRNGDWMIIAEEWLSWNSRGALTHELLHLNGEKHQTSEEKTAFIARENACGGASALEAVGGV